MTRIRGVTVRPRRPALAGARQRRVPHALARRPLERVAVYVRGRPPRTAEQVCETWRADGYLAGEFDGPALLDFAEAVLRGERPVRIPDVTASPLARLVGRLRRGR